MTNVEVFRPKSNYGFAAAALVLDGLFVVQGVAYPDGTPLVVTLAIALAVAAAATLLWLRPKLVLGDTELKVVNPLSSRKIAYADIVELKTKWSLLIVHNAGSTRVWVAPTSGRVRWASSTGGNWKNRVGGAAVNDAVYSDMAPASDSVQSDSGLAALLIRRRMDELGRH